MILIKAEYFKWKAGRFFRQLLLIAADDFLRLFIRSRSWRTKAAKFTVDLVVEIIMQVIREHQRRQAQHKAKQ